MSARVHRPSCRGDRELEEELDELLARLRDNGSAHSYTTTAGSNWKTLTQRRWARVRFLGTQRHEPCRFERSATPSQCPVNAAGPASPDSSPYPSRGIPCPRRRSFP